MLLSLPFFIDRLSAFLLFVKTRRVRLLQLLFCSGFTSLSFGNSGFFISSFDIRPKEHFNICDFEQEAIKPPQHSCNNILKHRMYNPINCTACPTADTLKYLFHHLEPYMVSIDHNIIVIVFLVNLIFHQKLFRPSFNDLFNCR